ncbi:hypothetical protein ACN28E_01700 [Archangium lansingense]|uniref:hypothetical protein n=1 Tax=Archangium lansingense TaxID=2995310 RepID=UPI003B7C5351
MKSVKTWLLWVVMLGAVGCNEGVGDRCDADTACPEGLACSFPPPPRSGPVEDPQGVCDYPLKAEGEPCSQAAECQTALTCSNHFTPNTRYGQCVPKHGLGEACFQDRDCAAGTCEGADENGLGGTCAE